MTKKRKVSSPRNAHVGKDRNEKEAYKAFILSKDTALDRTNPNPVDASRSDESALDEDEDQDSKRSRSKSWPLKILDNIQTVVAVATIVIAVLGFVIKSLLTDNNLDNRVSSVESDVGELKTDFRELRRDNSDNKADIKVMIDRSNNDMEGLRFKKKSK